MYNFDPYNVLLSIATNIPVMLMTASVLQGHKYCSKTCDFELLGHSLNIFSVAKEKWV